MNPMHIAKTIRMGLEQKTEIWGRVVFIRSFGSLTFIVMRDAFAEVQVGIRGKIDPPQMWSIVKVSGITGKTQKGEFTVWTDSYETLAVCSGDIPSKFHGINDPEAIHHNRSAYLIANPDKAQILFHRSRIIQNIRDFFYCLDYHEVETPVLNDKPSGATANPFKTYHKSEGKEKYLRIATEIPLKMAIVAGYERVFEIGKIFRNEGLDRTHRPEFTSIELYETCSDIHNMMHRFKELIDCLMRRTKERTNDENLLLRCSEIQKQIIDMPVFEYDFVVSKYGEDFDKHLQELCFVTGQPIEQTPLCKKREDGKADRFEVFANGFEIANAFQEINTAEEQEERFNLIEKELRNENFLNALKYGMPKTAGMGIGIDRLLMYILNIEHIRDVQLFP